MKNRKKQFKFWKNKLKRKLVEKDQGITLIALIISIIVIVILAGITMTLLLDSNSVMNRAFFAREQTKIQTLQERLELEKGALVASKGRSVELEEYLEYLQEQEILKENDIVEEDEKNVQVTLENDYVFLIEKEDNGNIKIEYLGKAENIEPKIEIANISNTTNSITVQFKLRYASKYYLWLKQEEGEYEQKENKEITTKQIEYSFKELKQGKKYTIKIEAESQKGKKVEEQREVTIGAIDNLTKENTTFIYNKEKWTKEDVIVTAQVTGINLEEKRYKLQTSQDGKEWEDKESQTFQKNGKMYVRLVDDAEQAGGIVTEEVDRIDKTAPNVEITISGEKEQTKLPIKLTVKVTFSDEQSGVAINSCKYSLNQSSKEELGAKEYTQIFNNKQENIEISPSSVGDWYLHILRVDTIGNVEETIEGPITISGKYHEHIGNSTQNGGCYTIANTEPCTGRYIVTKLRTGSDWHGGDAYCNNKNCNTYYNLPKYSNKNGASNPYYVGQDVGKCEAQLPNGTYSVGCGKTEETLEAYIITY